VLGFFVFGGLMFDLIKGVCILYALMLVLSYMDVGKGSNTEIDTIVKPSADTFETVLAKVRQERYKRSGLVASR